MQRISPKKRQSRLSATLARHSASKSPKAALAQAVSQALVLALAAPAAAHAAAQPDTPAQTQAVILSTVHVKTKNEDEASAYAPRISRSALGLDLSRRETPQSISIIGQRQIEDFSLTGVNTLLDQAPGIHVERVETDRTYYTARGFDIQTFQFDGIGMPFSNSAQWGDMDTAVFERVDILRGANGLLTSTGNPSATINFIRKRPTADFQGSVAATIGSWNQKRVEGDVSGALSDGIRGRLVVVRENKDSYLDRYGVDNTVASGSVDFDLGENTVLNLGYTEQRNNADSPMWGALPLHYDDGAPTRYHVSTSTATDWAYWDNKDRRGSAELTHQLGESWLLQASLSYRELDGDSELFYVYGSPNRATGEGLFAYPSAFVGNYRQTAADLRASGPFTLAGRDHELMLGVNWGREKARERSDYGQGIGDPVPDISDWDGDYPKPSFDNGTEGSSWLTIRRSAYAAVRLNLADPLKLILGANATHIESSGENYGVAHAYSRSKTSPYIGVVADLSDTVSAYASYTKIFNPQTEVDRNAKVLAPIEGKSAEAGIKTEWFDKRLMGSVAVFRTHQDNTAQAAGSFANFKTFYEGVDATSTGYELELAGKPAQGWDISASYTQFRLVDDDGHNAREFVPRRMARLTTSVEMPGLPALKVGGALRYQSVISTEDEGAHIRQGGYTVLDLMAKYDFSQQLSLAVNLDNVTDKKYLTSLYWTQAYYAAPRHVSATLRWKF